MSKNLDVLLRAKIETELFQPKGIPQNTHEVRQPSLHIDPIVREEEAKLVQRLFLLSRREVPRVVVFCGLGHGDGAVRICARAGESLASQTGSAVCVVEGNLHSPSMHQYFGADDFRGLTDAVLESGPIRDFVHRLPGRKLSVLSAGSRCGEAQALWKSERLRSRIAELRAEFSYVLINGPPVNLHVDAMLLGQMADGVILILESNVTRRETARTAKENLAAANVKLLGAVLNNRTFSIPDSLYRKL